jgi:hypothetical protein
LSINVRENRRAINNGQSRDTDNIGNKTQIEEKQSKQCEPLNSGQIFQTLSAVLLENWLMAYSRKNSGSAPITRNDRYGIKTAPGM